MELEIRPANRKDAEAVRDFLEHLSEDSRWLRYHSAQPIIKPWMVESVVGSDHDKREALIALHDGAIVGVAEWGRFEEGDTVADVAVVVDEAYRRRGVAKALMRELTKNGREHGIERFAASVLSVNRPMIAMLQRIAPVRETTLDGPTLQVFVPLAPSA
jgi:RimJ/RimL family protein N-acetyltransferase